MSLNPISQSQDPDPFPDPDLLAPNPVTQTRKLQVLLLQRQFRLKGSLLSTKLLLPRANFNLKAVLLLLLTDQPPEELQVLLLSEVFPILRETLVISIK